MAKANLKTNHNFYSTLVLEYRHRLSDLRLYRSTKEHLRGLFFTRVFIQVSSLARFRLIASAWFCTLPAHCFCLNSFKKCPNWIATATLLTSRPRKVKLWLPMQSTSSQVHWRVTIELHLPAPIFKNSRTTSFVSDLVLAMTAFSNVSQRCKQPMQMVLSLTPIQSTCWKDIRMTMLS